MSQYEDDDDIDFDGAGSIKQIRKALRDAEKRNKALEDELSSFRTLARKDALRRAVEERNLNPKIAAFIPKDVEVDSIGDWLDEYADVFGSAPVATGQDEGQDATPPEGAGTFSEVTSGGVAPTGDQGAIAQLIASAKTKEDLDKILFGKAF